MKKRFQRILAGTLAIVMVLTSFVFDWGNATEAEAASDTSTKNIVEGEVYSDIDFTNSKVTDLDEYFIASQGPKGSDGTEADSVATHWGIGEEDASVSENVAEGGNLEMPNVMEFLINSAGFQMTYLTDDIKDSSQNYLMTNYSSVAELEEGKEEYVTVTFPSNAYYEVEQIKLYPSLNKSNYAGFPVEFEVNAWDGTKWVTVATQTEEDGYDLTTSGCWSKDITPIVCNAIEIKVSKLSASGDKNSSGEPMYALALAEIEAWGAKTAATYLGTVDMAVPSWAAPSLPKENLVDGDPSTYTTTAYLSESEGETVVTETGSVTLTFANGAYKIDKLVLSPRLKNGTVIGFPKTFTIDAWNGSEWIEVAGKENHTGTTEPLVLDITPTVCSKIRLDATVLGESDNAGQYCLQLSEFEAWGEKVEYLKPFTTFDDENITMLTPKDAVVENFRAEIEMLNYDSSKTRYGLFLGQENPGSVPGATYVTAFSTVAGCVFADAWTKTNSEGLVLGGIKAGTAKYAEENYTTYVDVTSGTGFNSASGPSVRNTFAIKDFSTTIDDITTHTLNIEVIEGVLKIWWSGFENAAWTVELADGYTGGYVSLFSQGADQGGIKSFKVQELFVRYGSEVDFTESDATALDETFVASQGANNTNGTVATEGVAQYWNMGGTADVERKNVALSENGGTPALDNVVSWAPADRLNNGETSNLASTGNYESTDVEVNATITFNGDYVIDQVIFTWYRAGGSPEQFELQVLLGNTWETIATESNCSTESSTWSQDIEPIICKGIRLKATKLRLYSNEINLRIKEMEAYGTPATNAAVGGTAEMEIMMSSLPASYLNDDNHSTWTSTAYTTETDSKTAIVTFNGGAYYTIDQVRLFPRGTVDRGFPVDFTVSVWNGNEWVLATEPITNCDITEKGYWSQEIEPILCNAIKIEVTKLGVVQDNGIKYGLQLAEIEAWGQETGFLTTKEACANGNTTMLTWKEKKLENFKAEIEMLDYNKSGLNYGLYFGQSDFGVVESGVVNVIPNASVTGGIFVGGTAKMDVSTAAYVDSSISSISGFNKNASGNYVRMNYAVPNYSEGAYDNLHTLNVEVIDGIIKVWWSGHEEVAWTIAAPEEYKDGYVSLYATGNDLGGIKNFTVYEILDEDITTNVDMNVEVIGEYVVVTVNNDIAGGILKSSTLQGKLKFDSEKFNYCTTVIEDVSADRHDNIVHTVTEGGVSLDMTSYSANAVATFYFKNTSDELNFTDFVFDVDSFTRTNKETASATTTEAVVYDYTGAEGTPDKLVDARDLVRAAKDDKTPADVRNALVGIHADNDWVTGVTGEVKDAIYVDAVNGSYTGDGTAESPLSSLTLASYRVADNGTIHVVGDYALTNQENTIGMGGKNITITGESGNLILTGISEINVVGELTFDNIGVTGITADPSTDAGKNATLNLFANGHHFTVTKNARFTGYIKNIYAGNLGEMPLETTNMELYGGSYGLIYGGSRSVSTIIKSTNLVIGGTVNHDNGFDEMDSDHTYNEFIAVYGGSQNGYVKGDTNVTIQDQAHISMVNGGGYGASSIVAGSCNVYVNGGETVGYYGGSLGGTVYNTNLVMTAGTTEQIFGGSWVSNQSGGNANITGNVNVTVTGGTVTRRIYGGCYNEHDSLGILSTTTYKTEFYVNGNVTVTIGSGVNYTHADTDSTISALSRHSTNHTEEVGKLYIEDATLCGKLESYFGNGTFDTHGYDELYVGNVLQ